MNRVNIKEILKDPVLKEKLISGATDFIVGLHRDMNAPPMSVVDPDEVNEFSLSADEITTIAARAYSANPSISDEDIFQILAWASDIRIGSVILDRLISGEMMVSVENDAIAFVPSKRG